jgi:hypothetical protein
MLKCKSDIEKMLGCKWDNQNYNHHFGEHLLDYFQYIFICKLKKVIKFSYDIVASYYYVFRCV